VGESLFQSTVSTGRLIEVSENIVSNLSFPIFTDRPLLVNDSNFISTPFGAPPGTITSRMVIGGALPIATIIVFECRMDLFGHRLA
jgi:hypothetical protein